VGDGVGGLVSWEPFDFGLRKANVDAAESARRRAQTEVGVTKLQVGAAAADSFLTILAAQQTVDRGESGRRARACARSRRADAGQKRAAAGRGIVAARGLSWRWPKRS
jgi:outer membrane protein TolC